MDKLLEFLGRAFQFLLDVLLYIPRFFFDAICEILATLVEAIPAFSWLPSNIWSSLDPGIAWFLTEFQFPFGITVMLSALTTRFLIRRLPFIG